jgi:hypothetical protein
MCTWEARPTGGRSVTGNPLKGDPTASYKASHRKLQSFPPQATKLPTASYKASHRKLQSFPPQATKLPNASYKASHRKLQSTLGAVAPRMAGGGGGGCVAASDIRRNRPLRAAGRFDPAPFFLRIANFRGARRVFGAGRELKRGPSGRGGRREMRSEYGEVRCRDAAALHANTLTRAHARMHSSATVHLPRGGVPVYVHEYIKYTCILSIEVIYIYIYIYNILIRLV